MILPASHIAVVFLLAVFVKIKKYEYEHAVTRLMLSALYVFIAFDKDMTEAMRQFLVRWFCYCWAVLKLFPILFGYW